jgi:hypothetical protein
LGLILKKKEEERDIKKIGYKKDGGMGEEERGYF